MVLVLFRGRKHAASKALCQPPQNGKRNLQLQQCQEVWRMDDKSFLIGLFEAQCGLPAGILANLLPTAWAIFAGPSHRSGELQRCKGSFWDNCTSGLPLNSNTHMLVQSR